MFSENAKRRLILGAAILVYYYLLHYSFINVEAAIFGELGFARGAGETGFRWLGVLLAIVPVLWMPLELNFPSQISYWMLYLFVAVPTTFVPNYCVEKSGSDILVLQFFITFQVYILSLFYKLPPIKLSPPRVNRNKAIYLTLGVACLSISGVAFWIKGFQLDLSVDDVYDRRLLARELVQGGSLLAYALAFLSGSLYPLLLVIGYTKKNLFMLGSGLIGVVAIFSFFGTKSDAAIPFAMFIWLFLLRYFKENFGLSFTIVIIFILSLSVSQYLFLGRYELSTHFTRRLIIVPGVMTGFYWDYFSTNSWLYFSETIFKWFYSSKSSISMSRLIGAIYFGSAENNANANIWASGFANLGYFGMTLITICLGITFRLLDSIAKDFDFRVVTVMAGIFGVIWANGGFETSLVTNGVLPSIVILYFLRTPKDTNNPELTEKDYSRSPSYSPQPLT